MFEFVRKHTKVMMFVMFLLIIPSFVVFGISGYDRMREKGDAVARVGSHDITQAEWDAAHRQEVDRIRARMPTIDVKLLDTPQARYATLERLVQERVLADAADKAKLTTSDERLLRSLKEDPSAGLVRADGSLDVERYRLLAGAQGMSTEMLDARIKTAMAVNQVQAGLTESGFAGASLANVSLNAFFEKREVQVARFNTNDFVGKVNPTEAELETYYKANQSQFQAPEQASIEYVVLDLAAVKKGITLNESDVKAYYDQNAAKLSGPEERKASHILINAPKDAPAAERAKAKARAQELLAQVRKAPATFADVAKKESQDTGSGANGGDLGFFARGAMVKPFEDAAFSMKAGDISDLVESDFGYHIIKLVEIKTPKQRSFEEMRAEIENDLKTQQAQKKYAEAAEAFTNGVYEQSDSLKPIADKLKLEVKTAANLQRKPLPGATGELANAKLLAAVFSADSIEKNHNTEAVEIGPNQLASAHITKYAPARTQPFAEVHDLVKARWVANRAAEMAKKEGADKLAAWKANGAGAALEPAVVVSRDKTENLPPPVVDAVLRANAATLPAWTGVDLGPQGYVVVKVNKLVPRAAADENAAKMERTRYERAWASAEAEAYYKLLKDRFKAQIKVAEPAKDAAAVTSVASE
jgi:peptidyl-prolyl cis-trans isomerase D